MSKHPGWENLGEASKSKIHARWLHHSDWQVRHCGHPTALWPYYLVPPDGSLTVMSHNGLGFKSGEIGRKVVELILAGEISVTTDNCVEGIGRVFVTTHGEVLKENSGQAA